MNQQESDQSKTCPSIVISAYVDVRTLASVISVFNQQDVAHKSSWSSIIRLCMDAVANQGLKFNVGDALEYLKSHGFQMSQLRDRTGVKKALQLDVISEVLSDVQDKRATEIADLLKENSNALINDEKSVQSKDERN